MALPAGKRFFDQYSVICVFGSVVGCVVVPLLTQSFETIIFSAILLSLTAKTLTSRATQADTAHKEERRRNRDATSNGTHKIKKKRPIAHQHFVSAEDRERQRLEDLKKQEEIRRAEKEKKTEEKKEKKAKRKEDRMKKKTDEPPKPIQDRQTDVSYLGCKTGPTGKFTYTPPALLNEITKSGHPVSQMSSYKHSGHYRNNSDSLRSVTGGNPRRSAAGSVSRAKPHLNPSTRSASDPLMLSNTNPVTEALAFNPQPPAPPSSPKTKAWQQAAAAQQITSCSSPDVHLERPCWYSPPSRTGGNRRSNAKIPSSPANSSQLHVSQNKVYSAPSSVNHHHNSVASFDFLSKSMSLESISHTGESTVWTSNESHPPSPTSTPDSPIPEVGSYYSLFGNSGNVSPFGADLLSSRGKQHWE